jgi:hypothetical protein
MFFGLLKITNSLIFLIENIKKMTAVGQEVVWESHYFYQIEM